MKDPELIPLQVDDNAHLTSRDPWLLDYLDSALPAARQAQLDEHVARCPRCQALCAEWRELDDRLAAGLTGSKLSTDFESRVLAAIEAQPLIVSEEARRDAKARLEAEAERTWAEARRSFIRAQIPRLLDWVSYAAAAGLAIALVFHLVPSLLPPQAGSNTLSPAFTLATSAGVLFLLATAILAVRPRLSGLLNRL